MMRCSLLQALAAVAVATVLPAQRPVTATTLVQFPPGVLTLNAPLLDALLAEPAVAELVHTVVPDLGPTLITVADVVQHPSGQCQFTLRFDVGGPKPDGVPRLLQALRDQLQERLEDLVRDQREQLDARRKELADRLQRLELERTEVDVRLDDARNHRDAAVARARAMDEELAATAVALATEERTAELLARMRHELETARGEAAAQRNAAQRDLGQIDTRLREVSLQLKGAEANPAAQPTDALRAAGEEVAKLATTKSELAARHEQAEARCADATSMLTLVLERLPQHSIELQRLQARRMALQQQRDAAASTVAKASEEMGIAGEQRGRAERLATDAKATAAALAEVQGQLVRLHPVVVRLLRSPQ